VKKRVRRDKFPLQFWRVFSTASS